MIKIMIVDDEPIVRKCLRETIDWQSYGCEISGEAANGRDALRLYEKTRADIIITDIIMSKTTGVEMIEKLREMKSDVKIIIITGYENFDYAKKAIENSVSAYILKPAKNELIIDAVLKIKNELALQKQVQKVMDEHLSRKQNEFLTALLSAESLTREQCRELSHSYGITLTTDVYSLAAVQIDKESGKKGSVTHADRLLLNEAITYNVSVTDRVIMSCEGGDNKIILLFMADNNDERMRVEDFLHKVQTKFFDISGKTVTVGLSGIFRNLAIIKRALRQAETALNAKTVQGKNKIIRYTDRMTLSDSKFVFSDIPIDDVVLKLKEMKFDASRKEINYWFDSIASCGTLNLDIVKNNILELVVLVLRSMVYNTTTMRRLFGRVIMPAVELQEIETLEELKNWTLNIINCIESQPDSCLPQGYSTIVQKAVLYIMENYSSQITIEQAAANLYISPRSLTRIFKKETGKTFGEYLADYRIKTAVYLLEHDTRKTFEIAALVGYRDPQYFHKLFKKMTGHSTGYYRKNNGEKNNESY